MRELFAENTSAAEMFGPMSGLLDGESNLLVHSRDISVLVVEDTDSDFFIISRALQALDTFRAKIHRVDCIASARAEAERQSFDIALVDYSLGMETGSEVIRELGGRGGSMAVVLVTAMPGQEIPQIALRAGAIHSLDKNNLSVGLLETTIRSALYTHALETRLQRTIIDLERANLAKADFFERLGRDLRTPLSIVLANADAIAEPLDDGPVTPENERCAHNIRIAANHLMEVLDNLVFHSAGDDQSSKGRYQTIEVEKLVRRAVDMIEPAAQLREHELSVSTPDDEAAVNCLPSVLTQAILNVLSNAVKYTPEGGRIEVTAQRTSRWIEVSVTDNGIGMSRDDICVALLPFGRVDLPPELAQEGTGIGLPVVRDILKSHGGQLEIDSVPERGTTIILRLPTAQEDQFAA